MIYILISFFTAALTFAQENHPIREGLGLNPATVPQFTDSQILESVRQSLTTSQINPVSHIEIGATATNLKIKVIGDSKNAVQFSCSLVNSSPDCKADTTRAQTFSSVEIPFAHTKDFGLEQKQGHDYLVTAAYVGVVLVTIYAAKKVLNKIVVGSFSVKKDEHHDHSLFPTDQQMRKEMQTNRELFENAMTRAESGIDDHLLQIAKPLVKVATCAHEHGFHCEQISEPQATAAKNSLLNILPHYAVRFGKDFYDELISPIVDLVKASGNKETRKQIWSFFDLTSRRMVTERGVGAAIATGTFVGLGQLVVEILESFVMPAGLHMFCQVGNAAVMAAAANIYNSYLCFISEGSEFQGKGFSARWRTAQQLSQLSKMAAKPKTDKERIVHAFNLLFRIVERDLRHARNLGEIPQPESRQLAARLGTLRYQLSILSIWMLNDLGQDSYALKWLKSLSEVQRAIHDSDACADLLNPAA